jgi:putative transposase
VTWFVSWYNTEHRHSAIRYVTPEERHSGREGDILAKRCELYEAAKAKRPDRWTGKTREWSPVRTVVLNPEASTPAVEAA